MTHFVSYRFLAEVTFKQFNLTTVRKSRANKLVVGLLSFLIDWILDAVNII